MADKVLSGIKSRAMYGKVREDVDRLKVQLSLLLINYQKYIYLKVKASERYFLRIPALLVKKNVYYVSYFPRIVI